MKEKVITIKPKGISQKQWANLLLELNLVKKAWRPYGVDMQINAPGLKNILKWGTKRYDRKRVNGLMARTLIILVLLFDGTLVQERYELGREMPVSECLQYGDDHREAIAEYKRI